MLLGGGEGAEWDKGGGGVASSRARLSVRDAKRVGELLGAR